MGTRRHSLNESYFSSIETEDQAYWLGFLTADGCVVGNQVTLKLSEKDHTHVLKYQQALVSSHKIAVIPPSVRDFPNAKGRVQLGIKCKQLVADLAKLGVHARKSLTVSTPPPGLLPSELKRHYWRGVFDGDGCISKLDKRTDGTYRWILVLVGSKPTMEAFVEFIKRHVRTSVSARPMGNIWRVSFGGSTIPRTIARLLYGNASVYLDRKMALAREVMAVDTQRAGYKGITAERLAASHEELGNWTKVAQAYGICTSQVVRIRRREGYVIRPMRAPARRR